MPAVVYIACCLLSLLCALQLMSGFRRNKVKLLFWTSLGFFGFALNNALLFIDLILLTEVMDLSVIRTIPALAGMIMMLYGLISESV